MNKISRWILLAIAIVLLVLLIVRHHYVINSAELDAAIRTELPVGSSKMQVIEFIQSRHPMFCDDLGSSVKARLSGLAVNMIYGKEVVLTFRFDSKGRLMSYSKQETLTFF